MKQLKSKKSLIFTSLVFMIGCQAPVITQTGNSGNSTSSNIVGSTGSSVNNETDEQRNNSGSGPKINVNCIPNLNVDTPIGNLATGLPPCPSETNGSPFPTPTPSASPSGSPSPSPSPSGSPSPSPSPTPTPVPTPSGPQVGPIGPDVGAQATVKFLGTQKYGYSNRNNLTEMFEGNFNYPFVTDLETNISYLGLQNNVVLFNDGVQDLDNDGVNDFDDFTNGVVIAGPGPTLSSDSGVFISQGFGLTNSFDDGYDISFRDPSGSDLIYDNPNIDFVKLTGSENTLLILVDMVNNAIRLVDPDGDGTFDNPNPPVKKAISVTLLDNSSSSVQNAGVTFISITDVAVDPTDNNIIYIVDNGANKIYKYNISSEEFEHFAGEGTGKTNDIRDGEVERLDATFLSPTAIDVAPNGDVFVGESGIIRRIDKNTGKVSIYAGLRVKPSTNDPEVTDFADNTLTSELRDGSCLESTLARRIGDIKVDAEENLYLYEATANADVVGNASWLRRISNDCSNVTTLLTDNSQDLAFFRNRQSLSGFAVFNMGGGLDTQRVGPHQAELSFDKDGNIRSFKNEGRLLNTSFGNGTSYGRPVVFKFN